MLKYEMVPIPKSRVIVSKVREKDYYVYHISKGFRNSKGKPDNKKTLIGRANEDKTMMRPNDAYFELFNINKPTLIHDIKIKSITNIGGFIVFDKLITELGIKNILSAIFKERLNNILSIIQFMLINNKAIMHIDEYLYENKSYTQNCCSQKCSEIFNSITFEERQYFFKRWTQENIEDEYYAYDITSRSSYSYNNEYAEYGYNRDHEELPQTNTGVIRGEKSRLPIYYVDYYGSIPDKTFLQFMLKNAEDLGIEITKFVLDTGFYSIENLKYMANKNIIFIVCMAKNSKSINNIILKNKDEIVNAASYIRSHDLYGKVFETNITTNTDGRYHVFYDIQKRAIQEKTLYKLVDKYELELGKIRELTKNSIKKYSTFFDLKENDDKTFSYQRNNIKIEKEREKLGYFAFVTNDLTLTAEEAIKIYKGKDLIEKYWLTFKNFIDAHRTRVHSTQNIDGKNFISFISLIIRSSIEFKVLNYVKDNNITIDKIFSELNKIKLININNNKRLCYPITKKQREILNLFGISEEDIINKTETF